MPEKAKEIIDTLFAQVKNEYMVTDPNCNYLFEPYVCKEGEVCDPDECLYVEEATAIKYYEGDYDNSKKKSGYRFFQQYLQNTR